jgi:hypothetical protein
LGKEVLPDEMFDNFTYRLCDLIDLIVGEHLDEAFFEVYADEFAVGGVFLKQNGEKVKKGVLYFPGELFVLSGEGTLAVKYLSDHFY